jgi:hypothetical protein
MSFSVGWAVPVPLEVCAADSRLNGVRRIRAAARSIGLSEITGAEPRTSSHMPPLKPKPNEIKDVRVKAASPRGQKKAPGRATFLTLCRRWAL